MKIEDIRDNLQKTIEQYGARVRRPTLMDKTQFENLQINNQIF